MNAILEFVVVWLLWTAAWWAVLATGVALWFRLKPPQTATVRHAALAAAIIAGTLVGLLPRWGSGLVSLPRTEMATTNNVMAKPTVGEPVAVETTQRDAPEATSDVPTSIEVVDSPTTIQARALTPAPVPRDWLALGKNVFVAAWVLGTLFLSIRLVRAIRMTIRWRREATPLPDDERTVFVAMKKELHVDRATGAGLHTEPATPVVLCGWPPMVLAPSDWSTWAPVSRVAAWRHELDHVRRFDDWWRMLSEGLRVLFWFHPGVHWLLSRREQEAELLSDEAAVAAGCPPQELAQVLIDVCRRPHSPAWTAPAGTFFSPTTMKVRIARLLEAPSAEALCRPAPRGLFFAALAGMAVLALAGSMRWITANAMPPEEKMDLAQLERKIAMEPTYRGKPLYCLLAFGKKMEPRWLVLDIVTEPGVKDGENVAYFDRDGDGDLTKPGNRIVSTGSKMSGTEVSFSPEPLVHYEPQFDLGDVRLADGTKHTKFKVEVGNYVHDYRAVKFRLILRGKHDQLVAYAPGASLLRFGESPADAPVVHLDGPLTFRANISDGRLHIPTCPIASDTPERRQWYKDNAPNYGLEKLHPGKKFRIEAELGTHGLGRGTFAKLYCGTPPDGVHPQAELTLPGGKTLSVALSQRYATTMFGAEIIVPAGTPVGKATIKLSFPDWPEGKVETATDEIEVAAAKDAPIVSRLEPDRKARVGELLGVQIEVYPVAPRGGNPTTIEADGTIKLPDLPPIAVVGKTAEEIEELILTALGKRREVDTHVAVCFLRAAADVPDPPAKQDASAKPKPNYITVVGQLLDDETGMPIEKAGWEWGMGDPKKPDQIAWGHSRQSGGNHPEGKFEMLVNIGADGNHYPLRVYSAGYETTDVVIELAKPYPEKIERIVKLKRGRNITGVLRDHEGKPVANGWVFFIPKGHRSNIVEGLTGTDSHNLPSESRDGAVSEVRTNANGTFSLSTGADGTLAASTDLVDLWPFALPEDGHAELKMPAPSYLVIDLTYWYLDDFAKKGKRAFSPDSEDPNQCWIQVDQSGSADPLWKALDYRRQMFVFAKDTRAKLSKGVIVGHVIEGEMPQPIPDIGHNKNLSTVIRVALPPGSYRVQRLRAGPFAPVDEQQVELKSGEDTKVSWDRGDGSSVRGKATWPADMMFVRQPGEESRKLDWTVPSMATVFVAPINADGKEGKRIEAAKIQADGNFFVATNLDPGKYKATATVYMPMSDGRARFSGARGPDCIYSQEFTVPDPARGPFGSRPLEVEIKMEVGKGGRFVGAEAPQQEKEPFTAWGKEAGGLQAGLGFKAGEQREYRHGETVSLVVRVRNVGTEEVKFQCVRAFLIENPPIVTDAAGKLIDVRLGLVSGRSHPAIEMTVAPGKGVELTGPEAVYELKLELSPAFGTGKVQLQYERVLGNSSASLIKFDPALEKLGTGKLELVVKDVPAKKDETPAADEQGLRHMEQLQGSWQVVEAQVGGTHAPRERSQEQVWTFTRDKLVFDFGDGDPMEMTYRIDEKQVPATIDLSPLGRREKGSLYKGIYELDGDQLKVHFTRNSADSRPTELKPSGIDRGMRYVVLKRAPKAEAPAEKAKEPFTAWGETVGGLQAGLGFKAGEKGAFTHGEKIALVLRVRNVGKEAAEFKHIWAYFVENPPVITDADGKPVQLPRLQAEGEHGPDSPKIAPGKAVELYEWKLELRPETPRFGRNIKPSTLYGTGKFSLQCERIVGPTTANPQDPNPAMSKLATGKLELVVHEAPAVKQESPADPPKAEAPLVDPPNLEKPKDDERYIKVSGQVIDDATGQPIETCLWELGYRDPKNFANTLWGFSRGSSTDHEGKFSRSVWVDKEGVHTQMRVKVAGYEPAVVIGDLPEPLPESIERIIRMKRTGESVSGVVRDHQGKPAAGAKVFFIPEGHSSNIVEGVASADQTSLPIQPYERVSRDGNVAESVADAEGRFQMPIAGAGTLAVSADQVDLWPFPMPAQGKPAELKMPAPATLVIELDEWRLDGVYQKPKDERQYASNGDPRECWLLLQGGPAHPTGDEAIDAKLRRAWRYERPMFILAPRDDARISRRVSILEHKETSNAEAIAGFGVNTRLQAKIQIMLPPGNYSISRAKIGGRGTESVNLSLKAGEVHVMDRWKRAQGAAVRGTVKLPTNMQFVRQPGEAPKKLDWSVARWAYVWIRSANLDRQEYAEVDAEGRFAVPTHLPPGKYQIEAHAVLPDRDRGQIERTGLLTELVKADLKHDAQTLTIPEPRLGQAGSPPLEVELVMKAISERIVAATP